MKGLGDGIEARIVTAADRACVSSLWLRRAERVASVVIRVEAVVGIVDKDAVCHSGGQRRMSIYAVRRGGR